MNTFLPYADFSACAGVLDRQRLGKQRVECKQIYRALHGAPGWANHPAVRMWRGHSHSLARYAVAICREWRERGYRDSLLPFFETLVECVPDTGDPPWLGNCDLHRSHQSNLVRKNRVYYVAFFGDVPPDLPYVWPV